MINLKVTSGLYSNDIILSKQFSNIEDVYNFILEYAKKIINHVYYYRYIYFDDCIVVDFGSHNIFYSIYFDTDEEKADFVKKETV